MQEGKEEGKKGRKKGRKRGRKKGKGKQKRKELRREKEESREKKKGVKDYFDYAQISNNSPTPTNPKSSASTKTPILRINRRKPSDLQARSCQSNLASSIRHQAREVARIKWMSWRNRFWIIYPLPCSKVKGWLICLRLVSFFVIFLYFFILYN